MRIFASDRVANMMKKLGMEEGEAIEHPWVSRAIENAQRKVEARNFDIRKQLLEFDDVANDQRQVVYAQRNELMDAESIEDTIKTIQEDVITGVIDQYIPPQSVEELWDVPGLEQRLKQEFVLDLPLQEWLDKEEDLHEETLRERIIESWLKAYEAKEQMVGPEVLRQFEKAVMLQTLDVCGKSTWLPWTTCVRGSTCEVMLRRTPNRNISVSPLSCSSKCWSHSSMM